MFKLLNNINKSILHHFGVNLNKSNYSEIICALSTEYYWLESDSYSALRVLPATLKVLFNNCTVISDLPGKSKSIFVYSAVNKIWLGITCDDYEICKMTLKDGTAK